MVRRNVKQPRESCTIIESIASVCAANLAGGLPMAPHGWRHNAMKFGRRREHYLMADCTSFVMLAS